VTLDLRWLGVWKSVETGGLVRVLVPVAAFGFVPAFLAGGLLFTTDARKYAALPLFQFKMSLITIGIFNVLYQALPILTHMTGISAGFG